MVKNIILDLDGQYIRGKEKFIQRLEEKYVIMRAGAASSKINGAVVLTDKNTAEQWEEYAVIGIEHRGRTGRISYVLEDLEDITDYDIKLAYARKNKLPCIIATDEDICIREMKAEDIPALKAIYDEPEIQKNVPLLEDIETEIEKTNAYIKYMYGFYGYGMWIIEDNHTGKIIGRTGIEHRELEKSTYYELGYLVAKEYRGKGYGYRAAQMAVQFAKEYGMKELITCIREKNIPSIRLSEKLGFVFWKAVMNGTEKICIFRKQL